MERQYNTQRKNIHDILTDIITSYKKHVIVFLLIVILGGGGYFIFNIISNSRNIKALVAIEKTDEDFQEIFSGKSINKGLDISSDNKEDQENIEKLITTYHEITDTYNKGIAVEDAYYRKGKLYLLLKEYEKSKIEFEKANKISKSDSFLRPKIIANLAGLAEQLQDIKQAKFYYQLIVDKYKDSIETPHAQFSLGRIAELEDKKNNSQTAQGIYLTLIENEKWQDSKWVDLAKSRLAFLGYIDYTTKPDEDTEDTQNDDK